MNWRRIALAAAATAVVVVACSGGVRLPAPVAAPDPSASPATTSTTLPPDKTGCQPDALHQRDPDHSPTRSYQRTDPLPTPGQMPANSTMAAIALKDKIVVGVSADTLLFGARNTQTGAIEGFDIDMLKAVATAIFGPQTNPDGTPQDISSKMEFRVITYAQRLPRLISGDVDLVAHTMTINCRRWQQIAFSSEYFAAGQRVLVKKGSGFASVEDLVKNKKTVCAPAGSTNYDELKNNAVYVGLTLIDRPDITDCLVAMQQGNADAASGDDTVLAGFAAQDPNTEVVGDTFTDEPYGIGIKGDAAHIDLVQFVNAVIEQMRTDGEWTKLYTKWLTVLEKDDKIPEPPAALYGRPEPTS